MVEVRRVEEKRRNELTLNARLGRQGKRAAVGPAYVVGWIGRHGHAGNLSCWRFPQFLERNQCLARHTPAQEQGFQP